MNDSSSAIDIVVIGAGGLGVPAVLALAARCSDDQSCAASRAQEGDGAATSGANRASGGDDASEVADKPAHTRICLTLVDGDRIEPSNLNRQIAYTEVDVGQQKVTALRAAIQRLLPGIESRLRIETLPEHLHDGNAAAIISGRSAVLDCVDSATTKLLINDVCVSLGVPLLYGAAVGEQGLALSIRPGFACLRCVFGDVSTVEAGCMTESCSTSGISGPVVGTVGFLQAEHLFHLTEAADGSEEGQRSGVTQTENKSAPRSSVLYRVSGSPPGVRPVEVFADRSCPHRCGRISRTLDLRAVPCPTTFLYAKLAMEQLPEGGILRVMLKDEATSERVMASIQEDIPHVTIEWRRICEGLWQLLVERAA